MKPTIYDTITSQIIAAIEEGAGQYKMPWHASGGNVMSPCNAISGRCYRGINVISLWMTAEQKQYVSGSWATFNQWKEAGCTVRKGEKSALVFFWKNLTSSGDEDAGGDTEQDRARFVAKQYHLFNSEQVEGYIAPEVTALSEEQRIEQAEAYFTRIPAEISHGGNTPCFIPSADRVQMVPYAQFKTAEAYYGVLAHELTHWSGAKTRLDRDLTGRFGSEAYAMEELVAELGAAFIAGSLGLNSEPRTDHAPYIATWLKVLKNDSRAIFTAAAKAQTAADYLSGF